MAKAIGYGGLAGVLLLGLYFSVLTLVSGWDFARVQFSEFWYFVTALSAGFSLQVGLYVYLKSSIRAQRAGGIESRSFKWQ